MGRGYERDDDLSVEIDILFRIYVIDRETGMQAKLYESQQDCFFWEFWDLRYFASYEKSGPLSQFSSGLDADTIPIPATHVILHNAYKGNPDRSEDHLEMAVVFCMINYKPGAPGTNVAVQRTEWDEMDILTFLENGLSYK